LYGNRVQEAKYCVLLEQKPFPLDQIRLYHSFRDSILLQGGKIKPFDKLRLALVYLLTADVLPSDADFQRIERAIEADVGEGMAALR
jgi:hypothetical protein